MFTNDYLANFIHRDLLIGGPLNSIVTPYIEALHAQRYAKRTIDGYLCSVTHFGCWMKTKGAELSSVDLALIEQFLQDQLSSAGSAPFGFSIHTDRAALRHLLHFLPHHPPKNSIEVELERFSDYLTSICGIAPQTCADRCRHVGQFLVSQFGNEIPVILPLTGAQIEDFLTTQSRLWRPASLRTFSSSLRSYFRFRTFQGEPTTALSAALPRIPVWKQATLPKVLSDAQVAAFLNAFDCADPVGMRDYAIARCLLDLGLRGHEVTYLTLDSVDWHSATLTIGSNKSKRVQQLPLPMSTGQAIVQYLLKARPQTSNRALFVRHRAPFDQPLSVPAIRNAMNRAFVRSDMRELFCNTHALRHTTATRLQRSGASIKEIADLLRHQSLDTASTYARVDLDSLRAVALAWPGSLS